MSLPTGVRAPATITDSGMRTPLARVTPIVLAADSRRVTPGYSAFSHASAGTRPHRAGGTASVLRRVRCRLEFMHHLLQTIDHVGIAVPDLDEALEFYARTFDLHSVHEEVNEDQGVREAMLAVGDSDTRIQLLAPLSADSTIAKFLDRNGQGIQQLAYRVADIEAEIGRASCREGGQNSIETGLW